MSESQSNPQESNPPAPKPGRYANRMGSKPCLDEMRQQEICAIVGRGCTLKTAADAVGVERRTVYRTALKNAEFGRALRKARSRGEVRLILNLHEAAAQKGDVRATTWLLSRCYRENYGDQGEKMLKKDVRDLFGRLGESIMREIRNPEDQNRVMSRLRLLGKEIQLAMDAERKLAGES